MVEPGPLAPGSILDGRYTIVASAGSGPSWSRWLADDGVLGRRVVVLSFAADGPGGAAAVDAARRAAGVDEPRLVRVLDAGSGPDLPFVVEESLEHARALSDVLTGRTLPAEETRRVIGEVANALEVAGSRGLHHLVLTPAAIWVSDDGAVKVRGLATEAALLGRDETIVEPGRADGLGLLRLMYAALTGHWPVPPGDPAAALVHLPAAPLEGGWPVPPSALVPGVPAEFDELVAVLGVDPAQAVGPASPGAVAERLRPWVSTPLVEYAARPPGDTTEQAPPQAPPEQAPMDRALPSTQALPPPVPPGPPEVSTMPTIVVGNPAGPSVPTVLGAPPARTVPSVGASGTAAAYQPPAPSPPTAPTPAATAPVAPAARPGAVSTPGVTPTPTPRAAPAAEEPVGADPPPRVTTDARLSEVLVETDAAPESPTPLMPERFTPQAGRPDPRLAIGIVAALVAVFAALGIWGLPRLGGIDLTSTAPKRSASADSGSGPAGTKTPAPGPSGVELSAVAILQGGSYEPDGEGQVASRSAAAAWDGNPATAWRSNKWYGSENFGGLSRQGYGLIADLGQITPVRRVTVTLPAAQDITVYVSNQANLSSATKLGNSAGKSGELVFDAPGAPVSGQLIIVMVTKLGPDGSGKFRAMVSELEVDK